ncbi:MAG: DUF5368 domain-containing protein [Cardiobacteriaceae bacterium]|nr:DUF5368 domain-containing protein [Cardiobacteriaceae bacterium]
MQSLGFETVWAILQSMLGVWLWPLVIAILLLTLLFFGLLVKEKGIIGKRFIHSQLFGVVGGVFGLWLMARLSESRFDDAGGPIDWIVILAVYLLGAFGSAILYYTAAGWLRGKR